MKRQYIWTLFTALLNRRLGGLTATYRRGRENLKAYAVARPGPVAEFITFRQTSYAISLEHVQMVFAGEWISKCAPSKIHDIGSHRAWVIGLGAHYPVTSLDVREPPIKLSNETFTVGRAEALPWDGRSIEFLVSLHSIEHFGLGAYGDDFDPLGDRKAAKEIARVVKPGGMLLLTTTVTGGPSYTVFDAHRVYSVAELHDMFSDFEFLDERFFSKTQGCFIGADRLSKEIKPWGWDLYLLAARRKAG
jgi:SAM-dependent methyltransferase